MVENNYNKSMHYSRLISDHECILSESIKNDFNIYDTFNSGKGLKYTWDNSRMDGHRILPRLDRFYIFIDPIQGHSTAILLYSIKGDCSLSNHLPVTITLKLGDAPRKPGLWKMNT